MVNNGEGLNVQFSLGAGPDRLGTAGAWVSSNNVGATGQTNLISTNGATWQITGVQLEEGSVATPFEHRQYGQELALCQRYYYKHNGNWGNAYTSSNSTSLGFTFKATMRAQPTMDSGAAFFASTGSNGTPAVYAGTGTGSDGNSIYVYNSAGNWTATAVIGLNAGFSAEL